MGKPRSPLRGILRWHFRALHLSPATARWDTEVAEDIGMDGWVAGERSEKKVRGEGECQEDRVNVM